MPTSASTCLWYMKSQHTAGIEGRGSGSTESLSTAGWRRHELRGSWAPDSGLTEVHLAILRPCVGVCVCVCVYIYICIYMGICVFVCLKVGVCVCVRVCVLCLPALSWGSMHPCVQGDSGECHWRCPKTTESMPLFGFSCARSGLQCSNVKYDRWTRGPQNQLPKRYLAQPEKDFPVRSRDFSLFASSLLDMRKGSSELLAIM